MAEVGVEGLNAMGGRGRAPARARGSALQLHALASLAARVETVPDCPPDVTKRGALSHVLATDAGYGDLHLRSGTHARFQRGKVALPRVPSGAVILSEKGPPLARDYLECAPCNPPLFASKPQEFLGRVATGTVLANYHALHGAFLQILWDRNMLATGLAIKVCGPFFVTKKDDLMT